MLNVKNSLNQPMPICLCQLLLQFFLLFLLHPAMTFTAVTAFNSSCCKELINSSFSAAVALVHAVLAAAATVVPVFMLLLLLLFRCSCCCCYCCSGVHAAAAAAASPIGLLQIDVRVSSQGVMSTYILVT